MRASLDTNAIIHLYKADLQNILFEFFDEGVFIYEQIRKVELENHGKEILDKVDEDIIAGKIVLYTDRKLNEQSILRLFQDNVKENRILYRSEDMGEVYAISLAQTLGAYALVTDDTKQGGPYMPLLQFDDDIMPFTFADILILRYLMNDSDEYQTVNDFNLINEASELKWSFLSQISKFTRRFWLDPYRKADVGWMDQLVKEKEISVKKKFERLKTLL